MQPSAISAFLLLHLLAFTSAATRQRLLLTSFNGFRHDFIHTYNLHNLHKLRTLSSSSPYLTPQFPTSSLPNQWSLATGAHAHTHAMISDNFYDPAYNEHFTAARTELKWWNSTAPIWHLSVRQNIRTGVFNWPGSDVSFDASNQTHTPPGYRLNLLFQVNSLRNKIDAALRLMLKEDYRFISIYHDQPGQIAEKYGINSPEFNVTLEQLDADVGYLMERLEENRLLNARDFNAILVSPHVRSGL